MMWWAPGWGWAGAAFMIICMILMARMMGHGGHRGMEHDGSNVAERTLANRLAGGEIDIDEYERLLEALRRTDGTAGALERHGAAGHRAREPRRETRGPR